MVDSGVILRADKLEKQGKHAEAREEYLVLLRRLEATSSSDTMELRLALRQKLAKLNRVISDMALPPVLALTQPPLDLEWAHNIQPAPFVETAEDDDDELEEEQVTPGRSLETAFHSAAPFYPPETPPSVVQPVVRDPNELLESGFRELDFAARNNRADRVAELLAAGADPSLRNAKNSTPMHLAAGHGSLESLKLLVAAPNGRAALSIVGPRSLTPLGYARFNHREAVVEYLLSIGAPDKHHAAAIPAASAAASIPEAKPQQPNPRHLRVLIELFPNGITITLLKVLYKIFLGFRFKPPIGSSFIQYLHDTFPDLRTAPGSDLVAFPFDIPPRPLAADERFPFIRCIPYPTLFAGKHVQKVIIYGSPNLQMPNGSHVLDAYAQANRCIEVAALLVAGADPALRNAAGVTAIHLAAGSNALEALHLLLSFSSELVNCLSADGQTPVDFARYHGSRECVEFLLSIKGKAGSSYPRQPAAPPQAAKRESAPQLQVSHPAKFSQQQQPQQQQQQPSVDTENFQGECPQSLLNQDLFVNFDAHGAASFSKTSSQETGRVDMSKLQASGSEAFSSLLEILPEALRKAHITVPAWKIQEVTLEYGAPPKLHLIGGGEIVQMLDKPVDREILDEALGLLRAAVGLTSKPTEGDSAAGLFTVDNRLCISGMLHRVSCVRFYTGVVIGLVYRIGRQLIGTASIYRDLLAKCCAKQANGAQPKSLLVIGRSGSGRTTLLREASRALSEELTQRVVIVDTSAEIGGGGLVSHPCITRCRRLFVPEREKQHAVVGEAVSNHSPDVVVVDDLFGNEAESIRLASQRGVSLVASGQFSELSSLLLNPTVRAFVGGVIEEQKQLRHGNPMAFEMIIEIRGCGECLVHPDAGVLVDNMLQNKRSVVQRRWVDADGLVRARFSMVEHTVKFSI